jgi:hypothetical protein
MGFTLEEAAEAFADHQERNPATLNRLHVKPLSAKTVRDIFERPGGVEWARANHYSGDPQRVFDDSGLTLSQERAALLAALAPHLIPPRLTPSSGKS